MPKPIRVQTRGLKIRSVSLALCALLFNSTSVFAQNWCSGKVTDRDSRIVSAIDKPRVLQTYVDPAFGTQVTRITNAPYGTARRTLYNTIQPWNADESLLMLYHTGDDEAGHHLYDGKTYKYIRRMEFSAADIEGIYWDEYDSSTLYFIQRRPSNDPLYGKLVKYNVNTRKRSLAADPDPLCGKPSERNGIIVRGGNDIQGIANNTVGLRCANDSVSGNSSDITFHANVRTGKISQAVTLDPTRPQGANTYGFRPDVAASTMHSGQRVVIQDSVFDADMNFLYRFDSSLGNYTARNGRRYAAPKLEHATTGQMPDGHDAIFSPRYDPAPNGCDGDSDAGRGAVVAHDVESGTCQVMVGRSTGWGYPLSGVHLSSESRENPGWVTMTTVGYRNLDYLKNGRAAPLSFSELSLTYADPDNPTTCRIAHTRTTGKYATRGESYRGAYFGEPHAVMSPSGSRVLFNSDWYDSGSVDTFAVDVGNPVVVKKPTPIDPVSTPEPYPVENTIPIPASVPVPVSIPTAASPIYRLQTQLRLDETPPRVYVDFADTNQGSNDRVTIARAGSPDSHLKMWLYTNGTPNLGGPGPQTGRLGFLQKYIGSGDFEARLFINGDFDTAVRRISFSIP